MKKSSQKKKRIIDIDTGWIRLNQGGLEETLLPLHIETLRMLLETHFAQGGKEDDAEPRILIEAMIFANHHRVFGNASVKNEDDAAEYCAEHFGEGKSGYDEIDLHWNENLPAPVIQNRQKENGTIKR